MERFQVFSVDLQNDIDYRVYLFGRTEFGMPVRINVTGFNHYFYIGTRKSDNITMSEIVNRMSNKYREIWKKYVFRTLAVFSENEFRKSGKCNNRDFFLRSVYGYTLPDDPDRYLSVFKVYVTRKCIISKLERLIHNEFNNNDHKRVQIFETRADWMTRFMADAKLDGSSWIQSHRDVHINRLRTIDCMNIAPYTICSFDIECVSVDGTFPQPNRDPIVQIAVVFARQDVSTGILVIERRITMSLGSCNRPISMDYVAECFEYETESELIVEFGMLIRNIDPDFIMGYNIMQFDLPYIHDRSVTLNVDFSLSRTTVPSRIRKFIKHGPYGAQSTYSCNVPGRVVFDMYTFIRSEFKYSSYKLDDVAEELLHDRKIDVHHSEIRSLYETSEGRRKLAEYCIKDAELPIRLADHTKAILTCIEMSRAVRVSIESVMYQQPQYKLYSAILRETIANNMLLPSAATVLRVLGINVAKTYRGAIVQNPKFGYYNQPVYVFDFASLYPSIMLWRNMCYSTHVPVSYVRKYSDRFTLVEESNKIPLYRVKMDDDTCIYFVKNDEGILPGLLSKLLRMRRETRLAESLETDVFLKSVLDRRQFAFKICANAIYGFTGVKADRSWLPCTEIAMSVTATG